MNVLGQLFYLRACVRAHVRWSYARTHVLISLVIALLVAAAVYVCGGVAYNHKVIVPTPDYGCLLYFLTQDTYSILTTALAAARTSWHPFPSHPPSHLRAPRRVKRCAAPPIPHTPCPFDLTHP